MAAYPATLPAPLLGTFSESPPDNIIRTSMDTGYAKIRRRTTAKARDLSYSLMLTAAQVTTLDTFYVTTTNSGADEFTYSHPRTGASHKARFTAPPQYQNVDKDIYSASVSIEILP